MTVLLRLLLQKKKINVYPFLSSFRTQSPVSWCYLSNCSSTNRKSLPSYSDGTAELAPSCNCSARGGTCHTQMRVTGPATHRWRAQKTGVPRVGFPLQ